MNAAEIARKQTNKQRQIIEEHRATISVFYKISESINKGEFTANCIIPELCLEPIKNKLEKEGFVTSYTSTEVMNSKKLIISW